MIRTARGGLDGVWGQAGGSIGEALESYQTQLTQDETAIQATSDERSAQLNEVVKKVGGGVVMALFGEEEEQKPCRR